MTPHLMYL